MIKKIQASGLRMSKSSDSNNTASIVADSKSSSSKNKAKQSDKEAKPPGTEEADSSSSARPKAGNLYVNKQRVLIISSRGITARYRHLLEDLKKLIPHHKKDNKLDTKGDIHLVNEIAEMKSCNNIIYLETRKHSDLYMYMGVSPHGPSAKFHVVNVHTTDELKLTGNCMLGSRPLLNFDAKFDSSPHWILMKNLFIQSFGTPKGHPKSKPFVDRVMSFYVIKNNVWIRNYQILDKSEKQDDVSLVEIGPRLVLIPIRIFNGSLGGATLYQNSAYVSPNEERSNKNKRKGNSYVDRINSKKSRIEWTQSNQVDKDPLAYTNFLK